MPATYDPIATVTLSTSPWNFEFTNIPQGYTDLRMIFTLATAGNDNVTIAINDVNTGVYGRVTMYGDGTNTSSGTSQVGSGTYIQINGQNTTTQFQTFHLDFPNYSNTTAHKAILCVSSQDNNDANSSSIMHMGGRFSQTNAITKLFMACVGSNFVNGTTATLYGILRA